jgi:peptide chain release factor 3
MFFGSAINNFGLEGFLSSFIRMMPPPSPRASDGEPIDPSNSEFSGFVFKVQANMNPQRKTVKSEWIR